MSAVIWSKPTLINNIVFCLFLFLTFGFWCTVISISIVLLIVRPLDTLRSLGVAFGRFFARAFAWVCLLEAFIPIGLRAKGPILTLKGGYFHSFILMLIEHRDGWVYFFIFTFYIVFAICISFEYFMPGVFSRLKLPSWLEGILNRVGKFFSWLDALAEPYLGPNAISNFLGLLFALLFVLLVLSMPIFLNYML